MVGEFAIAEPAIVFLGGLRRQEPMVGTS